MKSPNLILDDVDLEAAVTMDETMLLIQAVMSFTNKNACASHMLKDATEIAVIAELC